MPEPVIQVETLVDASPSRVWRAMQQGAMFPGTSIETDWQVGHPIVFSGEWQGQRFTDRGEIRSLSEHRELTFTHWSDADGSGKSPPSWHVVEYRLEPVGGSTRVRLRQFNEGRPQELDEKTRAEFESNWKTMLQHLKETAEH